MKNDILEAIAINSIFGTDEVNRVFEIFKTYDLLVAACEFAQRTGCANLEAACMLLVKYKRCQTRQQPLMTAAESKG